MLNDRLKEARLRAKLTQKEIADAVGIATTTYNGYERGKSDPDINTLCKMMNVLNVDANFIYQDYNVNKESSLPEGSEDDGYMKFVGQLTSMFEALGFIRNGGDITDEDRRFILSVSSMLNTYFENRG